MATLIKPETIERYAKLWNRIQSIGFPLKDLETISQQEFETRTLIKGKGQYNLAKSLGRNIERQEQVNKWLGVKNIPKTFIKRLPEKQIITPYQSIKLPFKLFTKKSRKFSKVQGKEFILKTTPKNFKKDIKEFTRKIIRKAELEKQKYTAKQIKVNITSEIFPDKNQKDLKETSTKSFQSKARVDKMELIDDFDDLEDAFDSYVGSYEPEGAITVSVSIVNYSI